MEKVKIDLNDLASGRVELATFQKRIASLDCMEYKDRHVQLSGCAPTWAHLLVAGKLFPFVKAIDFVIDDQKRSKEIEIFRR